MEILKAINVEKVYNSKNEELSVHALTGIDLSVMKGDFMVIAGASGSGKTTLLNILGTLDIPTKGEVFLEGDNLSKFSSKELSEIRLNKMGFIFQAFNLIPVLTALENIEFTMMLRNIPEKTRHEKAIALMAELGIDELKDKRPNQMSGGQQQRVAVARAIVNEPLICLADEPTANLDSKTSSNLLDLMQRLNEDKNITFIFSSHDNQIKERAKRLIYLKDGKIESENGKSV